jgi:selenide, water dikinase
VRLVLVGAGHSHLGVLKAWAGAPPPDCEVTVVTRTPATVYSGMLPGVLARHYAPDAMQIPVAPVAARAGAALVVDEAVGLDPAARRLRLRGGDELHYDVLSLDIGSEAHLAGAPGIGSRLVPLKPVEGFLPRWSAIEAHLPQGGRVAVAGGGAAGCEVALAMAHRLAGRATLVLVEKGAEIVPCFPPPARRILAGEFAGRHIEIRTRAEVGSGFDAVIWATGPSAAPWLARSGLACDARGFVRVTEALRSVSHVGVFAAGDAAALATPRPKAGVFAVRAAPVLAGNLAAAADERRLRLWRPQTRWLSLMLLGDRRALAVWNGLSAAGRWAWLWKDRIDRGFVAGFR